MLQTFKMLFLCIDIFYFLCIFVSCEKQTFHYNDKVWLILKDANQICSLFSICMPQILMLKPRSMNLYIKGNTHIHHDLKKSFEFSRYMKLKSCWNFNFTYWTFLTRKGVSEDVGTKNFLCRSWKFWVKKLKSLYQWVFT